MHYITALTDAVLALLCLSLSVQAAQVQVNSDGTCTLLNFACVTAIMHVGIIS